MTIKNPLQQEQNMQTENQTKNSTEINKTIMYECIIIGGGPAGISAAIKCHQLNLRVLLLEKTLLGGNIINIELITDFVGFPGGVSGMDLTQRLSQQFKENDIPFRYEDVTKIIPHEGHLDVITENHTYHSKTIIAASGTQYRELGVTGEKNFFGRGVSYCAPCDAIYYKDKEVLVVGNNERAAKSALYLTNTCKKVSLFTIKPHFNITEDIHIKLLNNPRIEMLKNYRIDEIRGHNCIEDFIITNMDTRESRTYPGEALFIYVGMVPMNNYFDEKLLTNSKGYLSYNKELSSNLPGIFVAGDIKDHPVKKVAIAVADGIVAATSVYQYVYFH